MNLGQVFGAYERRIAELEDRLSGEAPPAQAPVLSEGAGVPTKVYRRGLLARIRAELGADALSMDELSMRLPGVPRRVLYNNVCVAVCQGTLARDGKGPGARYRLPGE